MQPTSFNNLERYQSFFKNLISEERKAEMDFHLQEIQSLSGRQREKKGRAILLLTGQDAGIGIGGTYLVKLSRVSGLPDNEISMGDVVIVSKEIPSGGEPIAIVIKKTQRAITIAYSTSPPYQVYDRNLRLDLFSNDITFQKMEYALDSLEQHPKITKQLISNIELLEDSSLNNFSEINFENLNSSQKIALEKGLQTSPIFLIHGPPGTGKTTTLSSLIFTFVQAKKKVLVTAPSNTAVDNLLEKFSQSGLALVRIGNPFRVAEDLLKCSLDVQLQEHADYQNANGIWSRIQLLQKEQQDYIAATGKNKRGLKDEAIIKQAKSKKAYRGIPHSQLRKMAKWLNLQSQINALYEQANKLQTQAIEDIIDRSDIVFATNSGAGSELLKDYIFDIVCIDEATQATEPESLIPLIKGRKWVFAGDHQQLPPTVKSEHAAALKVSLFERLLALNGPEISHLLSIQYRMHEQIMQFSNAAFYDNKLHAHPSIKGHTLIDLPGFSTFLSLKQQINEALDPSKPIVFINYEQGSEQKMPDSHSYYNLVEIKKVNELADALLSCRLFPDDIGIISPYEQQVNRMKQRLEAYNIEIKSIDGFQGREKEVIIISLVRANEKGNIGFLKDYRRLNVALTRAKRKLIIVGNAETLKQDPTYYKLLKSIPIV